MTTVTDPLVNPLLTSLMLGLVLTGCSQGGDEGLRRRLIGSWNSTNDSWVCRATYEPSGRYTERFTNRADSSSTNIQVGAFQIVNGTLIQTLTNINRVRGQTTTNEELSFTMRMRVLRIDSKEFAFKYEGNEGTGLPTNEEIHLTRAAR
jgi:hypothetical protein